MRRQGVRIAPAIEAPDAWRRLRAVLWPDADDHADAIGGGGAPDSAAWIARIDGTPCGLCEASLRRDYVNGCTTTPVAFLEGLYVIPEYRRHGIARALVDAMLAWGRANGCTECASDAPIDNMASHALHAALGFVGTERVVFFRKSLADRRDDAPR